MYSLTSAARGLNSCRPSIWSAGTDSARCVDVAMSTPTCLPPVGQRNLEALDDPRGEARQCFFLRRIGIGLAGEVQADPRVGALEQPHRAAVAARRKFLVVGISFAQRD